MANMKLVPDSTAMSVGDRRRAVWNLRLQGKSALEIAREMGISLRVAQLDIQSTARLLDVTKWLESEMAVDMERLETLIKTYWLPATSGDLDAAEFVLKVMQRREKLLGLEAPKRIDIRAIVTNWAAAKGLDPQDVIDAVSSGLIPEATVS